MQNNSVNFNKNERKIIYGTHESTDKFKPVKAILAKDLTGYISY